MASPWVEWDPRIPRPVLDNAVIGAVAATVDSLRRGMMPPLLLLPLRGVVAVAHGRGCPVLAVAALPGIGDEAHSGCVGSSTGATMALHRSSLGSFMYRWLGFYVCRS